MASRGWESATMTDVVKRELDMKRRRAEKRATLPQERRSKYRAVKTVVDGVTFASKAEARRYVELKVLEKAGELHNLRLQHRIKLMVPAKLAPASHPMQKIGEYVADFAYCTCDTPHACLGARGVVEDVKGFKTPMYRWKKKHVEAQYGIVIREIK